MKCILCHQETEGSIGSAGIFWPNICQPCKDKEDKALKDAIKAQQFILDDIQKMIKRK